MVDATANTMSSKIILRCSVSISSEDYMGIFNQCGGKIDAVMAPWQSDFSLSGSLESVALTLDEDVPKELEIEIPEEFIVPTEAKGHLHLYSHIRLNVMSQSICTSINGTLGTSVSAESSTLLTDILRGGNHYQIGMVYKSFKQHVSYLVVSNVSITSASDGKSFQICTADACPLAALKFVEPAPCECAQRLLEEYAQTGSTVRQLVTYEPLPGLHKTIFREVVGINNCGYNILHSMVGRDCYLLPKTLNHLYEQAICCDHGQCQNDIKLFLGQTQQAGLGAAAHTLAVANATSYIVNLLMSYRADGRSVITPDGLSFLPIENWNMSVPRSCIEMNDCDGLSLLAISLLRSAIKVGGISNAETDFPYLFRVRNAIFPHYQVALSVIGAKSAEATASTHDHGAVAGHAITVLVPTVSFLLSLQKTAEKQLGGCAGEASAVDMNRVGELRLNALYDEVAKGILPSQEVEALESKTLDKFKHLVPYAIEGTTPTSSTLYVWDAQERAKHTKNAQNDKKVFAMASPNVFRSIKRLHVGAYNDDTASTHCFYRDLVELTFADDFPLYTNKELRLMSQAASQYVLTTDLNTDNIERAGCSPYDFVMQNFGSFPLVKVGESAQILDDASQIAKSHAVPPRPREPLQLSPYQTETLALSMTHIKELTEFFDEQPEHTHETHTQQTVAYLCAFNTLVHNPNAVKQFVDVVKRISIAGIVDNHLIHDLAIDENGAQVGRFIHIEFSCLL